MGIDKKELGQVNLYIIAVIVDNEDNVIGYRLFNEETEKIKDTDVKVIGDMLKAGVKIENAKLLNGKIVGVNGSLSRYTKVKNGVGLGKRPLVILGKYSSVDYKIVDYDGEVSEMKDCKLVMRLWKTGVANGKLISAGNKSRISAIEGSYMERIHRKNPYLVVLDYVHAKGLVEYALYYTFINTRDGKVYDNSEYLFENLGYDKEELRMSLVGNREDGYRTMQGEVCLVPDCVVHSADTGDGIGSINYIAFSKARDIKEEDREDLEKVKYLCMTKKGKKRVFKLWEIVIMNTLKLQHSEIVVSADVIKRGDMVIVRSATDEVSYSSEDIGRLVNNHKESFNELKEMRDNLRLLGSDIFDINSLGDLVKLNIKNGVSEYVIPLEVRHLKSDWLNSGYASSDTKSVVKIISEDNIKSFDGKAFKSVKFDILDIDTKSCAMASSIAASLYNSLQLTLRNVKIPVNSSEYVISSMMVNCKRFKFQEDAKLPKDRIQELVKHIINKTKLSFGGRLWEVGELEEMVKSSSSLVDIKLILSKDTSKVYEDDVIDLKYNRIYFDSSAILEERRHLGKMARVIAKVKDISVGSEEYLDSCIAEIDKAVKWSCSVSLELYNGEDLERLKNIEPITLYSKYYSEGADRIAKKTYRCYGSTLGLKFWFLYESKERKFKKIDSKLDVYQSNRLVNGDELAKAFSDKDMQKYLTKIKTTKSDDLYKIQR